MRELYFSLYLVQELCEVGGVFQEVYLRNGSDL